MQRKLLALLTLSSPFNRFTRLKGVTIGSGYMETVLTGPVQMASALRTHWAEVIPVPHLVDVPKARALLERLPPAFPWRSAALPSPANCRLRQVRFAAGGCSTDAQPARHSAVRTSLGQRTAGTLQAGRECTRPVAGLHPPPSAAAGSLQQLPRRRTAEAPSSRGLACNGVGPVRVQGHDRPGLRGCVVPPARPPLDVCGEPHVTEHPRTNTAHVH